MRFLKPLLLLLAVFLIIKAHYRLTDGFKISKITPSPQMYWEYTDVEKETDPKVKALLLQTFHYLGRGQQCYAFESADGKYVLKCVRLHKYRIPLVDRFLPNPSVEKHRKMSWDRTIKSFSLAFDKLKEETGLVYIHSKPTSDLPQITIFDKIGQKTVVDSNFLIFVLQKKVKPIAQDLQCWKDPEVFKMFLRGYLNTVSKRISKGIKNKNRNVIKNLGLSQEGVIEFDIGELSLDYNGGSFEAWSKKEGQKSVKKLRRFLEKNYPQYLPLLDDELDQFFP
jgi:hypothetical protein